MTTTSLQDALQRLNIRLDETVIETPAEPVCPTCQGTGYVRFDVHYTDPRFGKMYPCPEPGCPAVVRAQFQRTETLIERSSWSDDYNQYTFEGFERFIGTDERWAKKAGAYAAAAMFAQANGNPFTLNQATQYVWRRDWPGVGNRMASSVVLTGDVGMGKTSLAVAAVNAMREQGRPVVFIRALDLISRVQETYRDKDGRSEEDVLTLFNTVPTLVLDELTLKIYSENRKEILERVFRARDRAGLPMLVTTNLTLEQAYELLEPQIADILGKAHWVRCGGVKLRDTARKVEEW